MLHHNSDLPTRLNRIGLLHPLEGVGDALEFF